jgi:hypothetical protein
MDSPYPEGTLVKFEIETPDEKIIAGAGRVAWHRNETRGENEPAGIGLKFLKLSDKAKIMLDDILAKAEVAVLAAPPEPEQTETEEPPEPREKDDVKKKREDKVQQKSRPLGTVEPSAKPADKTPASAADGKPKEETKEEEAPLEPPVKQGDAPSSTASDKPPERAKSIPPLVWFIIVAIVAVLIWLVSSSRDDEPRPDTGRSETSPDEENKADSPPPQKKKSTREAPAKEEPKAPEPSAGEAAAEAPEPPAEEAAAETPEKEAPPPAADTLSVEITSSPEGATVLVAGKPIEGLTPLKVSLEPGKEVEITTRLDGYVTDARPFTPSEENTALDVNLKAARIKFRINSKPDGARIIIDGKWNGNTPYTFLRRKYKPEYQFKLEKRGFESIEKTLTRKDWVEEGRYYVFSFDEPLKPEAE